MSSFTEKKNKKQDIIVNKGKEKTTWINIIWDKRILICEFAGVQSKTRKHQAEQLLYQNKSKVTVSTCWKSTALKPYWGKTGNIGRNFEYAEALNQRRAATMWSFFYALNNEALCNEQFRLCWVTQEWEVLPNREGKRNGYFFITSISKQDFSTKSLQGRPEHTEMNRQL